MTTLASRLQAIRSHRAVNNPFYDAWTSRRFTGEQLRVFAANYGSWVRSFPDSLAALVQATSDIEAKVEYSKTLHSELGYGNPTKAHSVLLDAFLIALGKRLGVEDDVRQALAGSGALPSTQALIDGELRLYGHADRRLAVGAQLALEWQAYTMLRKLYEGARNYAQLWQDEDEFHEDCEYFYAHIGAAEKDHKVESLRGAEKYMPREGDLDHVLAGYDEHLTLIADLWFGIADKAGVYRH